MRQIELETLSNFKNKPVVEIKVLKVFDLDAIELEQYINSKTGKPVKKYSSVCSNTVWYKINKPYEEMKDLLINRSNPVIGFITKSKRYNNGKKEAYK